MSIIPLLADVWPYLAGAIGALAALLFARNSGANHEKRKSLERDAKARKKADAVRSDAQSLSDDDVVRRLADQWLRHKR